MKGKVRPNLLLSDCRFEEIQSLVAELQYGDRDFEVRQHIANWKRTGIMSEIRRYVTYFYVGILYFLKRKKCGAIVGWQQFYALIFCFCCHVFHTKKHNVVVALNYTYKEKSGKVGMLYEKFMQCCVDSVYLDYIHVPSVEYADIVSSKFCFPRNKIIVSTFGINDEYEQLIDLSAPTGYTRERYALSIGRSNRDFDFLIDAWQGVDYPLVIISDTYKGITTSNNIQIIRNVAGVESYPWIVNCGLMIIPIDNGKICSGDTVLLTAMSLKRKLLVTKPSTLAEMYITDGENAVLTDKKKEEFRNKVNALVLGDEYEELGERARKSFLANYSRKSMGQRITAFINRKENGIEEWNYV